MQLCLYRILTQDFATYSTSTEAFLSYPSPFKVSFALVNVSVRDRVGRGGRFKIDLSKSYHREKARSLPDGCSVFVRNCVVLNIILGNSDQS